MNESALSLLKNHVTSDRLLRHCFAVQAAMTAYADHFNQDRERWSQIGLLHDIDFEKHPDDHPAFAPQYLKEAGYDQSFIDTVLSHGSHSDIPRDTLERKVLFAVDEMASFIIAIALMRPNQLDGLNGKSVKKKMKDKAFAKAVNRDELIASQEALGVDFNTHVDIIVKGLCQLETHLQTKGMTLL